MRKNKRRSLWMEILILVQTNVLLALLLFGGVAYMGLAALLRGSMQTEVMSISRVMATVASSELERNPNTTPDLDAIIHTLLKESNGSIDMVLVQAKDGRVVHGSDPQLVGKSVVDAPFKQALSALSAGTYTQMDKERFEIATAIKVKGQDWGIIRVQGPSDQLNKALLVIAIPVVVVILIIVGLSALIARWRSRRLIKPLKYLSDQADRLAAGDLTVTFEPHPVLEIHDLGEHFQAMADASRAVLRQVQEASDAVVESSRQLSALAVEGTRSVEAVSRVSRAVTTHAKEQMSQTQTATSVMTELSQAIDQIAAGAVTQADGITQAHDLTTEMAEAIKGIGGVVDEVATSARAAMETARTGQHSMDESSEGMRRISTAVGVVATQMERLSESTARINEVISLIRDVADQTNLLALNAAIEAARAGEVGRGFAVVAEEVRSLANRTQSAASEVTRLVEAIQTGTREVMAAVEGGKREVQSGSELNQQTSVALGQIVESVCETERRTSAILKEARQLVESSLAVQTAIAEVAAVAEENSAAAEEMTAGSRQVSGLVREVEKATREAGKAVGSLSQDAEMLSAGSEEIAAMAESLMEAAHGLQVTSRRFKV